jgi:hypothetical protein
LARRLVDIGGRDAMDVRRRRRGRAMVEDNVLSHKFIVALLCMYGVVINGSHLKKLWTIRNTFRIKSGAWDHLGLWKLNDRILSCSNIIRE